jgi:hypothetical protein
VDAGDSHPRHANLVTIITIDRRDRSESHPRPVSLPQLAKTAEISERDTPGPRLIIVDTDAPGLNTVNRLRSFSSRLVVPTNVAILPAYIMSGIA